MRLLMRSVQISALFDRRIRDFHWSQRGIEESFVIEPHTRAIQFHPFSAFDLIDNEGRHELESYSPLLAQKPAVLIALIINRAQDESP
ncbi:hypothetical protein ABIC08_009175 [Bradyrhizobium sp. RT9b]|uniref:hypothetical protein n=1 Tax=Bradyrhizobium sp. RT9b TaxID=3156385 RepID=UPI0033947B73